MLRIWATALHAGCEIRVVQSATPDISNAVQDFFFLKRPMESQPLLEERCDSIGKPQRDVAGRNGSGLCNGGSTGCYASVTPLIAMTCGSHFGDSSSRRSNSGAFCFTRIFVSKSRPAEYPRYS